MLFRVALQCIPVSIAVPIRQITIVFAILLGIVLIREHVTRSFFIGSAVIIAGIILVNLGLQ